MTPRGGSGAAGVTAVALTALLTVSLGGSVLAVGERHLEIGAPEEGTWRAVMLRAWDAAQERRYSGEALSIVWSGDTPTVTVSRVMRERDVLAVSDQDRMTVEVGIGPGDSTEQREGWFAPLPAVHGSEPAAAVRAIADKYDVRVAGAERILDRRCTKLEVHRRDGASLRERLWVDDDSGLVLRRESYEGAERRLGLMTYLALDVQPAGLVPAGVRASRGQVLRPRVPQTPEARPVDDAALTALRQAGWTVPPTLPGGYEPVGVYAVDGRDGQPLHVVYTDGLYMLSLFQEQGHPDWDSLPEGATRAEGLDWHAYEWPGAVPRRLVWEASGTTFSLVGDVPPEEFVAIADALPRPRAGSVVDRLRRGLSRLLSLVPQ
ncbi:MAG: sigma-E factor regulatory protein RseB domain-containing protein [Egibacteraceae bacterium]